MLNIKAKFHISTPLSIEKFQLHVDRYRDIYHPMEGWDRQIKRAEAAHLILDIMKRLDILWNREINALPGWEDSL